MINKNNLHKRRHRLTNFLIAFFACLILAAPSTAKAASADEINIGVDNALDRFKNEVAGAERFLAKAKGILVFPTVYKAGFGIGGEYGEGALRINGKTAEYYNTMAASIGFQLGAEAKTILLIFTENKALDSFRNSDGWKVGVDGSVALITIGVGDSLDTVNTQDPIIAFVFGQKGLMYNLTLEGSKFTKMVK
ncbi:MAG: hypothetical protein G3M78_00870 [Candidatus Nitrohelix vancouverensis]|uniref:Ysc84 actin-binding domain-containing protein n=1 Tax=Candidatus Nitrohelix vancouverensis TaxID=2705534 RepID=A0A7T0C000_9BACT|nr:MAG: hypothetical protein G3M78_00870 [Candidatus Nitrohelix vancouverensis]